jgi:hypothetical protein
MAVAGCAGITVYGQGHVYGQVEGHTHTFNVHGDGQKSAWPGGVGLALRRLGGGKGWLPVNVTVNVCVRPST